MNLTEKRLVESYSEIMDGLSHECKLELLEKLVHSLRTDVTPKELTFFESFGAFHSEKSAEEINSEIKKSRKFRDRKISL